jgi:WD40 repeat protein
MMKYLSYLRRRQRPLLLGLCGVVMFALWLGVWVRVLPVRPRASLPVPEHTLTFGVSDSGKRLVTLSPPEDWIGGPLKGSIRVRDTQTHNVVAEFLGIDDESTDIRSSPDARFVIVNQAGENGRVRVFDTEKTGELSIPLKPFIGVASRFSPNSRFYAHERYRQFPESNTLEVWDLAADRLKWESTGNKPEFSPDSRRIAIIQPDRERETRTVVVFDVETGSEVRRIFIGTDAQSRVVDLEKRPLLFSQDGNRLAVDATSVLDGAGPHVILVFDIRSGELLQRHDYEPNLAIHYQRFSRDGSLLIRGWRKSDFDVSDPGGAWFFSGQSSHFLMLPDLRPDEKKNWFERLMEKLVGKNEEENPTWTIFRLDNAQPLCRVSTPHLKFSDDEKVVAYVSASGDIQIWDLPPLPSLRFCLLYAALPALLFTGLLWWRFR